MRETSETGNLTRKPNSIILISMINFVLGGISLLPLLMLLFVVIFGIFFSGDPLGDKMAGLLGSYCLGLPAFIGATLFFTSGIGMLKQKQWGYYVQMSTAILSIFSIIGIPYGVPVLMVLLNPETKELFSKDKYKSLPQNDRYYS